VRNVEMFKSFSPTPATVPTADPRPTPGPLPVAKNGQLTVLGLAINFQRVAWGF